MDEQRENRISVDDQLFHDIGNDEIITNLGDEDDSDKFLLQLDYLFQRLPKDFVTPELIHRLRYINTPSPLSSISEDELEELEEMDEPPDNKTIRELFYDVMLEKHYQINVQKKENLDDLTNQDSDVENALNDFDDEDDDDNDKNGEGEKLAEAADREREDKNNKKRPSSMKEKKLNDEEEEKVHGRSAMKSGKSSFRKTEEENPDVTDEFDDFNIFKKTKQTAILVDIYPDRLINDFTDFTVECPPEDIKDFEDCKSLKTVMEEDDKKDDRDYSLNAIVLIFKYDCRPLNEDEKAIEYEIAELVFNLNHTTVRNEEANLKKSVINGCVLVNSGVGIICFELSLFDAIRLVNAVDWSSFNQRVTKLKIFTNQSFVLSKFKVFVICRPFMVETDDRNLPSNDGKFEDIEKDETVQNLLMEISTKFGNIFNILGHQSHIHECGIAELPPCSAQELPTRKLLLWALDCPLLKEWDELINDIMQPESFYDYTNDSYPFPTDTFNLQNLYFLDNFKDMISKFYKEGFRPTFNDTNKPKVPIPEKMKKIAEEVFKGDIDFVPIKVQDFELPEKNTKK